MKVWCVAVLEVGGDNQRGTTLMNVVFPASIRKVIFKLLIFPEKIFSNFIEL